jgi:DNA-binding transcriptional regulator YiaG
MENDMEWKGKYKSELLMVCHMDAKAMHKVGAISDKEMREFDRDCLVSPPRKASASKGATVAQKPVPAYAAPAK